MIRARLSQPPPSRSKVIVGDQIGEGTASETAVVGETPNLAARLQALAQPNQILISAATRTILGDHFDLADLGAYEKREGAGPNWPRTARTFGCSGKDQSERRT